MGYMSTSHCASAQTLAWNNLQGLSQGVLRYRDKLLQQHATMMPRVGTLGQTGATLAWVRIRGDQACLQTWMQSGR